MSPNTPPRIRGFEYRGPRRYFVTVCTHRRQPWFADGRHAQTIAQQISPFFESRGFIVLAYCVMPDHAHLLLEGASHLADLTQVMHRWKQRTGFDWKRRTGQPLWQEGFHDRVLRDEDETPSVIGYLLQNPVRAGLVDRAGSYPWIGSSRFTLEELFTQAGAWQPPWKGAR